MNVTIQLRDGTVRAFPHEGRAGGSYTKTIRYEGSFAIVTDEWGRETAIPMELIAEVRATPDRW